MLKRTENFYSYDIEEMAKSIIPNSDFDIEVTHRENMGYIRECLKDPKLFEEKLSDLNQQIEILMPDDEELKWANYFYTTRGTFIAAMNALVIFIRDYQDENEPKQVWDELIIEFLDNFEYIDNEAVWMLNTRKINNILLTHSMLMTREYFKNKEPKDALIKINENIEELETHKIIAKQTSRVLNTWVNPLIKFYKKLYKQIKEKHFIEKELENTSSNNSSTARTDKEHGEEFNFQNNFDHVEPKEIYKYFKLNLVDKNYLHETDLKKFISIAFEKKEVPDKKIKLLTTKIEKIRTIFYTYYIETAGKPHGKKRKYAELLSLYFTGYTTKKVMDNFANGYIKKR